MIATPEFNGSIPSVLKNALVWASRPSGQSVLTNKLTAITGTGGRSGTQQAQAHLRLSWDGCGSPILEIGLLIPDGCEKFDINGALTDETVREQLRRLLTVLVDAAMEPTGTLAN
jgi:chromate reductase